MRRLIAAGFIFAVSALWLSNVTGASHLYSTGSGSDLLIVELARSDLAGRYRSLYCSATSVDQEPRRNAEAQKLKNPEPNNAETIEAGKKLYQRHCAGCHGPTGKGDGSLALAGGTPSDLTDDTWDYGSSDGEIFVAIRDGVSSDMLAYKEKLTEKQIWQIVNYLRSIGPKSGQENK